MSLLLALWLLPRNLLILPLLAWRRFISPLYGEVCRYYPSCTGYALGQLQQRGVVIGVVKGAWRVLRCHPWAAGGVDEVRPGRLQFELHRSGLVRPRVRNG